MSHMSFGRLPALGQLRDPGMLGNFKASAFSVASSLLSAGKKACNCFAISSGCDIE